MEITAEIQNIIFVVLLDLFFSIKLYEINKRPAVINTKIGLYFEIFDIYAIPIVPKPRDPNIRPPVQQKAAPKAVKMDSMLRIFSFISKPPGGIFKVYFISSFKKFN
ncbi:MAG: hypothetical protein GX300_05695 [Tissierellia bacterium]|nr:hypothetical protein [Tissierellia bacterium]